MANDHMRYDHLVEEALRGVVRKAVMVAKTDGLSGDHHFYLTFLSTHGGVEMPDHLREQYPEEMTIVLQHQFYDLDVDEAGFAVTLSFNSKRERLKVPFEAITTFADPSVNFALHFQKPAGSAADRAPEPARDADRKPAPALSGPEKDKLPAPKLVEGVGAPADDEAVKPEGDESSSEGPEKIVILDHFRNKE